MRMSKLKNLMITALGGLLLVSNSISVNAADTKNKTFDYTGSEQTYTVPESGYYTITVNGAQGGSIGSYQGGNGSSLSGQIYLEKNDILYIYVGAQGKTFNGGGASTDTSLGAVGGGASDIRLNGNTLEDRIIVAGGGGGANTWFPGGAGGTSEPGTTTLGQGESAAAGGGGGGYYGGSGGQIVYHEHTGNSTSGGGCYGTANKHTHTGKTTAKGGCYTVANGHVHDSSCGEKTVTANYLDSHDYRDGCTWHEYENCWVKRYKCPTCGQIWRYENEDPGAPKHTHYSCSSTTNRWKLGCGYDEGEIVDYSLNCGLEDGVDPVNYTISKGGSNYYDEAIITGIINNGCSVTGNGSVVISKMAAVALDYNRPSTAVSTDTMSNNTVTSVNCSGTSTTLNESTGEYEISSYVANNLPTPTLKNFKFLGWSTIKDISTVSDLSTCIVKQYGTTDNYSIPASTITYNSNDDIQLYAIWIPDNIEITLVDKYNGTNEIKTFTYGKSYAQAVNSKNYNSVVNAEFVKYDSVGLHTPTHAGGKFEGWYTAETGGTKVNRTDICRLSATGTCTFYARWTPNTYTVTFNANGGTLKGVSSKIVTYNSEYGTLPTASKSDEKFIGWCVDNKVDNMISAQSIVTETRNHTLYAVYGSVGDPEIFEYTGEVEYYTIPETGYYRLETYGAEGESYSSRAGGKGGYTHAIYYMKAGTKLAINVGGSGYNNGYNGGGLKEVDTSCIYSPQSKYAPAYANGGGATGIFLNTVGQSNVITMAGGGGGATAVDNGGPGGTTSPGTTTYLQGQSGQAGGGGGYYGGSYGAYIAHQHRDNNGINNGSTSKVGGICFSTSKHRDWEKVGSHKETYVVKECHFARTLGQDYSNWDPDTAGYTWSTVCACGQVSVRGPASGPAHVEYGTRTVDDYGWVTKDYYDRTCGQSGPDKQAVAKGGSNHIKSGAFYTNSIAGTRSGNGLAIITPLYEFILDTNRPTTLVADVNATNICEFTSEKDTLRKEDEIYSPIESKEYTLTLNKDTDWDTSENYNQTLTYKAPALLVEKNKAYNFIEGITEMPQATLKGWTFQGWYTEAEYQTVGTAKKHSGTKVTTSTVFKITNADMPLLGNKLYAHWDENEYFIRYVKNDTINNVYGDVSTSDAKFDTGIKAKGNTEYKKDTTNIWYTQTCLYDHDVQVLQNLYAKTGYFFDGWTQKVDNSVIDGSTKKGTGTGKKLGTKYNECEILKPTLNGEKFTAGKCNFNYITDAKQHETDVSVPSWSYLQSGLEDGSNTIIMYATWEPIRYSLQYNGTDNWNTEVVPYKQIVTNELNASSNLIRYDQYFTLDANKFTREAPHTIIVDGTEVVLKQGFEFAGWGFGQNTRQYATSPSWNLLQLNTKYDKEQGILERDYIDEQKHVRNVLSDDSIKAIEKYILDWTNSKTDLTLYKKDELHKKEIIQNIHVIWRRESDNEDDIDEPINPEEPDDPNDEYGIKLRFDLNGGYFIQNNEVITETVVLNQELFNEYFYEFDITGNENKDLLNNIAMFDSYGKYSNTSDPDRNYDADTGINKTFRKTDSAGNLYRFCGWSTEKGQVSPDYGVTIDGIKGNNFDAFDFDKNNKTLKIANDTTLYAIWEPELNLGVQLSRTLGGSADVSSTLTAATQNSIKLKGIPSVTIKPGEKGKYLIMLGTMVQGTEPVTKSDGTQVTLFRPTDIKVQFDSLMTGIYADGVASNIKDNLNGITPTDEDEPLLTTSNLNRFIDDVTESSTIRYFHVPMYLGTQVASSYGYPSYKSDGYDFTVTASRYSNFYKGLETVTAEFKIYIDKDDKIDIGGGGGGGTDPTPTPPGIDDDITPYVPTVLDELRTKLKIRIN